jgi:hypothetical protein
MLNFGSLAILVIGQRGTGQYCRSSALRRWISPVLLFRQSSYPGNSSVHFIDHLITGFSARLE